MKDRNQRFSALWLLNGIVNGLYEPSVLMKELVEMADDPSFLQTFREGIPEEQAFFQSETQACIEELRKAQTQIEEAVAAARKLLPCEAAGEKKEVCDE